MSAMLEAYDMPMLDYPTDHDIQMHPSSSDQWFPDESKMEEDAPGALMKTENYSPPKSEQMKTDAYPQDKSEVTIEIDMEPFSEHQNDEYEMQEDEEIHDLDGETQDVEVYDVSLAQSPFMAPSVDTSQVPPSNFLGAFNHTNSSSHSHSTSPITPHSAELPSQESHSPEITALEDISTASHVQLETYVAEEVHPDTTLEEHEQPEPPESSNAQHEIHSQENLEGRHENQGESLEPAKNLSHTENPEGLSAEHADSGPDKDAHEHDIQPESDVHPTSENSVGDPHEISEGVYIDPPPPVLLSVASEDQFDFSFFNESPDWIPSQSSGVVFLQHFPTLYYEPLSTVFDALREEEYVQSMFHLPESELVLDAVDLQLTVSEDNVYAREVTLHDLNVLHDVSGINGLLRMRLYASAPRFITRYQHLQDQVSRLNLEQSTVEPSSEVNGQIEIRREGRETSRHENIQAQQETTDDNTAESLQVTDHPLEKTDAHESEYGSTDVSSVVPSADHDPESYPPLPVENDELSQGGEGAHGDDGSEEPAADSESYLPPLPAEHEEDDGKGEASLPQRSIAQLDSTSNDLDSVDHPEISEHATAFISSNEDNQPDGVLIEAPPSDETGSYVEEQQEEGGQEVQEEEYEEYEEVHELHDQEGDTQQGQVGNEYDEVENVENDVADGSHADEEYFEDAVFPEEEDTASHSTGEDLEYVKEGEVDNAQETITSEVAAGDSEHIRFNNPDSTEKSSAASGSVHREGAATLEDSRVDHVLDSNELDKETEVSKLDNYSNLENGAEFESANVWESSTDPTGQETYNWEDDLEAETGPDTHWEGQNEKALSNSNHSSVTLSSKTSKRSFDEFEVDDGPDDENGQWSPPSSPDSKRSRVQ